MKVLVVLTTFLSVAYAQFTPETACIEKDNGYLAPAADKTKFYHCDNCIGVLKCCPAGLIFSKDNQACVWPKIGCGGCGGVVTPPTIAPPPVTTTTTTTRPTTTTTTTTTPFPTTTTTTTTTTTPRPTAPTTPRPTQTPPVVTPETYSNPSRDYTSPSREPECKKCEQQYRPHLTDPGKYIVCDHGIDIEMCCPYGLIWGDKNKACIWPNLGCNNC